MCPSATRHTESSVWNLIDRRLVIHQCTRHRHLSLDVLYDSRPFGSTTTSKFHETNFTFIGTGRADARSQYKFGRRRWETYRFYATSLSNKSFSRRYFLSVKFVSFIVEIVEKIFVWFQLGFSLCQLSIRNSNNQHNYYHRSFVWFIHVRSNNRSSEIMVR